MKHIIYVVSFLNPSMVIKETVIHLIMRGSQSGKIKKDWVYMLEAIIACTIDACEHVKIL